MTLCGRQDVKLQLLTKLTRACELRGRATLYNYAWCAQEPIGRATTPPNPASALPRSMSWMQEGEPAVIEVEITRF